MPDDSTPKNKVGRKPKVGWSPLHTKITAEAKVRLGANALSMGIPMGSILTSLILTHLPHVPERDLKRVSFSFGLSGALAEAASSFTDGSADEVQPILEFIARAAGSHESTYDDPVANFNIRLADEQAGAALLRRIEHDIAQQTLPPAGQDLATWARLRAAARSAILATLSSVVSHSQGAP